MNSWSLDSISESFASAAVEPELWVRAMDTIAAETGSVGAVLLPQGGRLPYVPSSETLLRSTEAYFGDGWCVRDERWRAIEAMVRRGATRDFDFISPDEMKKHPYYQEFLRPFGLQHFAGIKMAVGDDLWCVSIQRSPQQGPFSLDQMRKLALLSRRFASAGALARALGFSAANAVKETFELTKSAVALLNRKGEVLHLSQAAEICWVLNCRWWKSASCPEIETRRRPWIAHCICCCGHPPHPRCFHQLCYQDRIADPSLPIRSSSQPCR
jgi:hypothetical protein